LTGIVTAVDLALLWRQTKKDGCVYLCCGWWRNQGTEDRAESSLPS